MSNIDASQCWRIMPFSLFEGGKEWWILGPDSQPVPGGIVPTREEAFAIALEHNKAYGVNAVYVHGVAMKKGKWEQPPAETQITEESIREIGDKAMQDVLQELKKEQNPNDDITEQMDNDFEDYKKKMAEGAYPEAENVEEDVTKMKEINPDAPEEALRKLAVAAVAAEKRLKKVFFIDHNEDTPETVEMIHQSWHILPVTRDEDERETWWVLGMNNTAAKEASTAGPLATKEEAFAMALEHNRTLGLNAVYVHYRDENGKMTGDFEEPTDDMWEQMDKDFEDYLEKMAAGTYAEAAQVEKEVKEMMKASPHIPEDNLRKLAVAAIAATKRLHEMGFVGRFHKVKQLLGSAKQLFKNVISFLGGLVLFVAVMALSYCSEIISIISPAKTPETSETVDGKNDCVIVATEAYKRLRAEGVWAEVIGMKIKTPKGKTYGHAMCVYQPSKTDNLWVYDSNGSWQLSVQSADLRVIEWAFNQSLKDGYSASEFKVLAQEPVKARPARKAPGLQAAQRR